MHGRSLQRCVAISLAAIMLLLPPVAASADFAGDARDCVRPPNPQAAIAACTRLLQSRRFDARNQAVVYNNRGNAYYNLKRFRRAIQDYSNALRLNPRYAPAYNNRGNAFERLKQYRRAISDFDRAIGLYPRYTIAYNNRGLAYERMGRKRAAIRDYRAALRLNRNYRKPREGLRRLGIKAAAGPKRRRLPEAKKQGPKGGAAGPGRPQPQPFCKDVGGYEAYMKRTGKVCRVD